MKTKWLLIPLLILLALVLIVVAFSTPAALPLMEKLGIQPVCIQGDWPNIKIVSCPMPIATPAPRAVTCASGPSPAPSASAQPIIVDDDGSPDGLLALLYFLSDPSFDVRAVTVSCGEAHPEVFAKHLQQILACLGRSDIPVGVGRAAPLAGSNAFPDPWRQASDDLWGIKIPQSPLSTSPQPAADLIVKTLSASSRPVTVFVSGNHTNLAEALRLNPAIRQNIRAVNIMGGSIYVSGNIKSDWPSIDNSAAEWNIWVDPVAASEVFKSGLPLHLVPLDATNRVLWTSTDAASWAAGGSPRATLATVTLEALLRAWSPSGIYIWDLVAAISTAEPGLCPETPLALQVVTDAGPEQGRTAVIAGAPNAAACLKPDADKIRSRARDMLGK